MNGGATRTSAENGALSPSVQARLQSEALRTVREDNLKLLEEERARSEAAIHGFGVTVDVAPVYAMPRDEADSDTVLSEDGRLEREAPRPISHPAVIGYDPLQVGHDTSVHTASDILDGELPVGVYTKSDADVANYTADMVGSSEQEIHVRDTALWMDLGYAANVRHAEERRAAAQARAEDDSVVEASREAKRFTAVSEIERRQRIRAQLDTARQGCRKRRTLALVRLILAAVGAVVAILYDSIPAVRTWLCESLSPASYPLFGLLWMLLIALPFVSRLIDGVTGILHFAPARYSVTALATVVTVVYTALAAATGERLPLLEGIPLCMLAIAALSEMLEILSEEDALSVVSSGRALYVLTDRDTPAATTLGHRVSDELIPHRRPNPLTVLKTATVDRVLSRMKQYHSYMAHLNYLLPAALGLAIVVSGIALLRGGDLLTDGVRLLVTVYLAAMPAAYLLAMSMPLQLANRRLRSRGCAVIGAATPEEYVRPRSARQRCELLLSERDVIVAARRKEITLRDNDPTETDLWRRMANRLFHLLDIPLAVDLPLEDDGSPEALAHLHVEIAESDVHYMKVYLVDDDPVAPGTTEIVMGSHDALSRRGIRLPKRAMESVYRKSEDSHVLYLAFNGQFRIAYAAEYRVNKDFSDIAKRIDACGMRPVMTSYDPMLTSAMLMEPRFVSLGNLEVVRPDYTDVPDQCCASGVVSVHGGRDLVYPLIACRRMALCYRVSCVLAWLGYAAVCALSLSAVLTDRGDLLNTLWVSVAGILSTAVLTLVTWLFVRRPSVGAYLRSFITRITKK